ncbi:P22 phage major capsid protein family protein [Planomonospora algeriensis]
MSFNISDGFIPEIWSSHLQTKLDPQFVLSSPFCVNRDYENSISAQGSKVKIPVVADGDIQEYIPNTTKLTYERVSTSFQELVVDQADSWSISVEDIEQAQTASGLNLLEAGMERRAVKLAEKMDQYVGGLIAASTASQHTATLPTTSADFWKLVLDIDEKLNNQSVPLSGRFLVITPKLKKALFESPQFISADSLGVADAVTNGFIGRFLGYDVRMTTALPKATASTYKTELIAGHPMATSVAQQLTSITPLILQDSHAKAIRGLNVYGAKVIEPKAVVWLKVSA